MSFTPRLSRPVPLSTRLTRRLHAGTECVLEFVERKPKVLSGALMVSLATFGATAFGTAPSSPAQPMPVAVARQVVVEALALPQLALQREALEKHGAHWYRSAETRAGDTMASLLGRLGVLDHAALAAASRDVHAKRLFEGRGGKRVRASVDDKGRLVELVASLPSREPASSLTHFTRVTWRVGSDGLESRVDHVAFGKGTRVASGTIHSSLFAATDAVDLPDTVAMQIADIFANDIDFHRELRRGDSFRVVYEVPTADDEPATWTGGGGRILAAEFVNNGRRHDAVWYQNEQGRGQYYDFRGQSRRGAFLASPLEFTRVTSGFGSREHPLTGSRRQHLGIDYGAPTGTPVRTVSDGVIEFAGSQRGYGNVVIVRHSQQRTTLYAHLSRIDVATGQSIGQGDRIGAVGATGMATGPHLHFEFKVAGEHQDPLTVARAAESSALSARDKQSFASLSQAYTLQLQAAASSAETRSRTD